MIHPDKLRLESVKIAVEHLPQSLQTSIDTFLVKTRASLS
jgi:hypothetical protein